MSSTSALEAPRPLTARPSVLPMVWEIGLNVAVPMICYQLSKQYISPSEFIALLLASVFPTLKSVYDVVRRREIDPVSVVVLLGIAAGIAALALGGATRYCCCGNPSLRASSAWRACAHCCCPRAGR